MADNEQTPGWEQYSVDETGAFYDAMDKIPTDFLCYEILARTEQAVLMFQTPGTNLVNKLVVKRGGEEMPLSHEAFRHAAELLYEARYGFDANTPDTEDIETGDDEIDTHEAT